MDYTWKRTALCAGIGAATGLVNGLFGAGGGLLLVPCFCALLHLPPEKALPTSIAVILPLCLVSCGLYLTQNALPWDGWILAGGFLGGILGGWLFPQVRIVWLRRGLGLLILYSAGRMLFT